jgi:hypothetical protein
MDITKAAVFQVSEGPKVYDGDYEVIFSGSYNLYDNLLSIGRLYDYTFEFFFDPDIHSKEPGSLEVVVNEDTNITKVTLKKFRNQLGAYTTVKHKILEFGDGSGRNLYVSIYGKSVDPTANFLHLSINFYLK